MFLFLALTWLTAREVAGVKDMRFQELMPDILVDCAHVPHTPLISIVVAGH